MGAVNDRVSTVAKAVRGAQVDTQRLEDEREALASERSRLRAGIQALRDPAKTASGPLEAHRRRRLNDSIVAARTLPPGDAEHVGILLRSRSCIDASTAAARAYGREAQQALLQHGAI